MWKWLRTADSVVDISLRWLLAVPAALAFIFGWLVKHSPFLGRMTWPEAMLIGSITAVVVWFVVASSLAVYRYWAINKSGMTPSPSIGADELHGLQGQVNSLSTSIATHAELLSKFDPDVLARLQQQYSYLGDSVTQLRRVVSWLAEPLMAASRLTTLGAGPPTNLYPQATARKEGDPERAAGDFEAHFFYIRQYQNEARKALGDLQIPIDEAKLQEEERKITSNVLHCSVGPNEPFLWVNEEHKQTHLLATARADAIVAAWKKGIADSERAAVLDAATAWEIRALLDPRNNEPI